ncbi:hypothetical protein CLV35_0251 [Motilibacter peucedani]|uniref:Uncharacterized protein n=1 Tax=Motilibacter peucedani TaxID=598650 RepID=A0A420XVA4_9ACTN|nr:hypothetical protein [Motilibacter peucedani]RKS80661.1 hypothetical protein CLV35_0251 [Motilibacter peucedani]
MPRTTVHRYTRRLLHEVGRVSPGLAISRPAEQVRHGLRPAAASGLFVLHGPDLGARELHLTVEHDDPAGAFYEPETGTGRAHLVTVTLTDYSAQGVPTATPLLHEPDRPRTDQDAAELAAALADVVRHHGRQAQAGTVNEVDVGGIPGYQHDLVDGRLTLTDGTARWVEDHAAAVVHALQRTHGLRPLLAEWWTPSRHQPDTSAAFRLLLGRAERTTHVDQVTLVAQGAERVVVRLSRAENPTADPVGGGVTLQTATLPAAAATPAAAAAVIAEHIELLLPMPAYPLRLVHRGRRA